ncbi:DDHD domain-containing protein [Purpureocillium lavendulum]|uniref:DDHD domain-containing protein n=1 Tax=Purpureocillium lavendulum TaxID=1247861 RepID=A0AB34FFJ1_9HYPO|nr:DDHD domain-containing protein [Purpureocillium lavendulum]
MDERSTYYIAAAALLMLTAIPSVVVWLCSLRLARRRGDPARTWLIYYKIAYAFFCLSILFIFCNYLLAVLDRQLVGLDSSAVSNFQNAQIQVGILSSFFDELSVVGMLLALLSLGQASNLIHTGQVSSANRFTQWGAWGIAGLLAALNIVTFGLAEWQYSDDGRFFGPTQLQNLRRITFTMLVVQMAFNAFILIKAIMVAAQTRIEPHLSMATRYLIVCCVLMLVKTCYNVGYYADYVPLGDSETGQKRPLAYIAILDVVFNSWPAFISLIILFVLGAKKRQDGSVWSAPDPMQTAEVAGTPLNMHEMPSQQASWGYGYADQTHQQVPQGWHNQHQQPASPVMLPAYSRPQELPTQQHTGSYGSQFRHELPAVQYEKGPQIGTTGPPPKRQP